MPTAVPIFVSMQETQGQRENDFCLAPEGEIVTFPMAVCGWGTTDDHCGCRRSMDGVNNSGATTTMKVIMFEGGLHGLEQIIKQSIKSGDWPGAAQSQSTKIASRIIASASQFEVDTVVEYRDNAFNARSKVINSSI